MLTAARLAISRVDAPSKPRAAKTSSAAARMRALVEPGASRALSNADLGISDRSIRATDHAPTAAHAALSRKGTAGEGGAAAGDPTPGPTAGRSCPGAR